MKYDTPTNKADIRLERQVYACTEVIYIWFLSALLS